MKRKLLLAAISILSINSYAQNYDLVWSDEFDTDGPLNSQIWNFEEGFVRNHEAQWYQRENAYQKDGLLVIECRKETKNNPNYNPDSDDWRKYRKEIEYTSACVKTNGKYEFLYGRMEVRARIPVGYGAWPAIWTLGSWAEWPSCGEIDIMEFYRINNVAHILANAAWGNEKHWSAEWNSVKTPFQHFIEIDPFWASRFHKWCMDWDEDYIRIYLDGELLNEIPQSQTVNGSIGNHESPFRHPQYILLNLAIGGDNGGVILDSAMPMRYEIDYVRVYQKRE
ncbi:MAG: glycoside hydrolase family 16 protein [Marinilabiliaceae bacterium]|nr:glycoside hydrolase family 16 protein [Marinilabiliaceae bacterium]